MRLHSYEYGSGSKTAALIHGVTGDAGTWFEIAPWLVERGYRVIAVDLRGHGRSDRADSYTIDDFADDVVETLPEGLDLAIGHSLGGRTLSTAVERLRPARAIYLDPGWILPEHLDTDGFFPLDRDGNVLSESEFAALNPRWSAEHIRQSLSSFAAFDRAVMPQGARFLESALPPLPAPVPSLVVLADGSELVPLSVRGELEAGGYELRTVVGAGHVFFADDLPATLAALDGWV